MSRNRKNAEDAWSPTKVGTALLLLASSLTLFIEIDNESYNPWFGLVSSHFKEAWSWIMPVMVFATIFQLVFPATKRRPKILFYESFVDLLHIFLNSIFYITFFGVFSSSIRDFLVSETPWLIFDWASSWPIYFQSLAMLIMLDFLVYWRHRIEHSFKWLWTIHIVHHTSRRIDVLTTHRMHFLELMLGGIIVGWATSVSGLSNDAISFSLILYIHYNHFIHSNINVRFSSPLKYILISPFMHRWHHALEAEGHNKNFGVVFSWNDWLFGTAYHPKYEPKSFGLKLNATEYVSEHWTRQQVYPFRIWIQQLAKFHASRGTTK